MNPIKHAEPSCKICGGGMSLEDLEDNPEICQNCLETRPNYDEDLDWYENENRRTE